LADFQPKVPENYKNADVVMLHPLVQKQCFRPNGNQTKISSFRYYEFFGWIVHSELLDVMKRVDVITINDEEARQLSENTLLLRLQPNSVYGTKYVVIKRRTVHYCFMIFRFSLPLCHWKKF
jgi:sugar/nucleoside kinase (ribokinase family)